MRRTLAAALLGLALLATPAPAPAQAPLAVTATYDGAALVVAWDAPGPACVVARQGLLGCAQASPWRQGPSLDARLIVGPGETIEVRAYGADGELAAAERVRVGERVWLPSVPR